MENKFEGRICECCGQGDHLSGVASSGVGAFSILWCSVCIAMGAEPKWALEAVGEPGEVMEGVYIGYWGLKGTHYFDGESYRDYNTNEIAPIRFNDGREFTTRGEAAIALSKMRP